MFRKPFEFFNYKVRVDFTWLFIFMLVAWSLAVGFFPSYYPAMSTAGLWIMGLVGALIVFSSILIHECAHAWMGKQVGMRSGNVTLYLFGGVTDVTESPPSPGPDALTAVAGPAAGILTAGACWIAAWAVSVTGITPPLVTLLTFAASINAFLAIFNLIPALPLDGGRMLRAWLWKRGNNYRKATRTASNVGRGFGIAVLALGFFHLFTGALFSALWWGLLGMLIYFAASSSYDRVLIRTSLRGEPVEHFMKDQVVSVSPDTTILELVDDYIYKYHHKMFPVMEKTELKGTVSVNGLREIPKDQWERTLVSNVMEKRDDIVTVQPETDALIALSRMKESGQSRLLVVRNGVLKGIVTMKDMLQFLALKLNLESDDADWTEPIHGNTI